MATNFPDVAPSGGERLPEGTDSIIDGAAGSSDVGGEPAEAPVSPSAGAEDAADQGAAPAGGSGGDGDVAQAAASLRERAAEKVQSLKGAATDHARDYVAQGRDRATEALDNVVHLVNDAASQIDDKLGAQYGDYARRAGDSVAAFAETLRAKELEDLLDDARGFVRRSPAVALGAAAAAGFLIARVIKAGATSLDETAKAVDPNAKPEQPAA